MIWTTRKSIRALRSLRLHARPHRRIFFRGCIATVGVVLCRLAMPWPLRGFIDLILPDDQRGRLVQDLLPALGSPVLWLVATYVLLAAGLGACELIQRVAMKKFAAGIAHGLRAAALRGLIAGRSRAEKVSSADLVTRLISDVARIKAEVSGILVHGTQNGLLFLGVCAVFLFISPKLGLFFLIGGLLALGIGIRASAPVAASAAGQRKKEGSYAVLIEDSLEREALPEHMEDVNWQSARADARTTRLIAVSTLFVHVALAAIIASALALAVADVRAGRLLPGDIFLFIAYALTVHRRMVQVGRQSARAGKVFAHVRRVAALTEDGVSRTAPAATVGPLARQIRLQNVSLRTASGASARSRLRQIDLTIDASTRVAVLGDSGAGKSSLLKLLAGRLAPDAGRILWDGVDVSDGIVSPRLDVGYLPQNPAFRPVRIWRLIGLPSRKALDSEREALLRGLGGWRLIASLPRGVGEKIGAARITRNEARALRLAGLLTGAERFWCLDAPLEGLDRRAAGRRLRTILEATQDRTLVVSMSQPVKISRFDRVLVLSRGRICFNGDHRQWRAWRPQRQSGTPGPTSTAPVRAEESGP